jgi:GTPase SAR1 family protein
MKEIMIKVIVAGEPGSGKSIIAEVNDACLPLRQLGVSIGLKTIAQKETQCCMTFITWTLTEGRPKDTSYFEGSKAAVIVSDLTRKHTIKKMKIWAESIVKSVGNIPLVFVGNNVEKAKGKNVEMALKIAKSYDSPMVLTSLEDKESIEKVFIQILKSIDQKLWDKKIT